MARQQKVQPSANEVDRPKRGRLAVAAVPLAEAKNNRTSRSVPQKDAKDKAAPAKPAKKPAKRSVSATAQPKTKTEERPAKRARSLSARPKKTEKTQPKKTEKTKPKKTEKAQPKKLTVKEPREKKSHAKQVVAEQLPKKKPAQGVKRPQVEEEVQTVKKAKVVKAKKEEEVVVKKLELPLSRHGRGSGVGLACGQNDCGQLGMPQSVESRKRPQRIPEVGELLDVAAGGLHSVVLTVNGEVYTFGNNDEGALGRITDEEEDRFEAAKVDLPGRVYMISTGDAHCAALLEDGRVFVWGIFKSASGDLGLVSNINGKVEKPVQILPDILFMKIVSGENHMALLSETGQVYTFGCPEQGQLGRIGERTAVIGSGRRGLSDYLEPKEIVIQVVFGRKRRRLLFSDVWAGGMATFLKVKDSGEIYVCGLNNYNQILPEVKDEQIVKYYPELNTALAVGTTAVAAGQHHTLALVDGNVMSFGSSTYGRLGTGDLGPDKPAQAEPTRVDLGDKKVVDIAVGTSVSFAITSEGECFSWGMGTNGQLGSGSEDDLFTPHLIQSKETQGKKVIAVSGGGQHALFLVKDEKSAKKPEPVVNKENGVAPEKAPTAPKVAPYNPRNENILSGDLADSESTPDRASARLDSDVSSSVFSP